MFLHKRSAQAVNAADRYPSRVLHYLNFRGMVMVPPMANHGIRGATACHGMSRKTTMPESRRNDARGYYPFVTKEMGMLVSLPVCSFMSIVVEFSLVLE